PQDRPAGHLAGDGGGDPHPRARPGAPVRHRVGIDEGRPGHDDGDLVHLHVHQGLPAVRDELHRRRRAGDHRAAVDSGVLDAQARGAGAVRLTTARRRRRIAVVVRTLAAAALTLFFLFPIYWLFMI